MAISPLEARATEVQLLEAVAMERLAENHLRIHPSNPLFEAPKLSLFVPFDRLDKEDASLILLIVAERFRRLGWHVAVDLEAGRLIFNDATPEF